MTRAGAAVNALLSALIAALVVIVGSFMLLGCGGPAFDVAQPLDVENDSDVASETAETGSTSDTLKEEHRDSGATDSGPFSDTDTAPSIDSAPLPDILDTMPPPVDVADSAIDSAPDITCSRYCWKSFGTTTLGSHCDSNMDCCSTSCDNVGVGATHTCVPPTDPAPGTWCGGTMEWCSTFASAECVP